MRLVTVAVLCLSIALTVGCQKKPVVAVHPGAVSNLDSYAYDILLVESAALDSAIADYHAGKVPEGAKSYLNDAIRQFNLTQAAWHGYHDNHATGDESKLRDALNSLVSLVAELQQVLGKSPTPKTAGLWIPQEVMA